MRLTIMIGVLLLAVSCGAEQEPEVEASVVKVRVYRDGKITLDGFAVTLEELTSELAGLKQRGGAVWYYRENGSEPHVNAMAVLRAVVDARLPISMSSEEDFSNVVLPDGTTKARD